MIEVIVNAVKEYGGIKALELGTWLASFGASKCVNFWKVLCFPYHICCIFLSFGSVGFTCGLSSCLVSFIYVDILPCVYKWN